MCPQTKSPAQPLSNTAERSAPVPHRTALVHDWLVTWRGGERVLKAIDAVVGGGDIFTLIYDATLLEQHFGQRNITPAPVHNWIPIRKYFRYFLPLFPAWVEAWDLSPYDLVISTSHCVAKGVIPRPDALHISYVHTPMRYIWDQRTAYFGTGWKARLINTLFLQKLRTWDVHSSNRVDVFIANSQFVAHRIAKYYRRDAIVLHPPIDTDFFTPDDEPPERGLFLAVSALVPYKRLDVLVEAMRRRPNYRAIIVGDGPLRAHLRRNAPPNIEFRQGLSDEQLRELYRRRQALVLPGVEDFGMIVAETNACGRPAIVNARGGAPECVEPGVNGFILPDLQPETLAELLDQTITHTWSVDLIRARVENLSVENFKKKFGRILDWALDLHKRGAFVHAHVRLLDQFPDNSE